MSTLIRFTRELAEWLTSGLDGGAAPSALVGTMVSQKMQPVVAQSIVDAFIDARRGGGPVPVDSVVVDETAAPFLLEPPRLRPGARLAVGDRIVGVAARCDAPGLAVLTDLMTADECEALIALARPRLQRSTVVDPDSGQDVVAAYRTSDGMFFRPAETPLVARLDRRFAALMGLPLENGEGFQVLRYGPGAGSAPHFDFLLPLNAANQASIQRSGQRVSTVVAYLNDVEGGGETIFPHVGWSVAPQRGNGVYFDYCNSRGELDRRTLHAGAPITAGEKWVATKWMRQRPFIPAA